MDLGIRIKNVVGYSGIDPNERVIFKLFHLMAHISYLLKFCKTPKNICFADPTKKMGIILIHSHETAIVVLAVVIFLFDNLGKRGQVLHVIKTLAAHQGSTAASVPQHTDWKPLQ